ncbi:hypothetical protein DPMN_140315 [Dreissena polymorpha]|uniref:Uncharacterized protein n=1 Tax=Dreissena polymorpha TaxID=45954 RepID=A0A9D4G7I6_DREPO|nr:hypothetical protein DPMN_140315 [Dreissena polymorpha]
MQNALVDHDDRRGDLVSGEWIGSQLRGYQECQYQGPQHSNQKRQDCGKHSEALGQLSSGMRAMARQDGATLEIEINCNILVE